MSNHEHVSRRQMMRQLFRLPMTLIGASLVIGASQSLVGCGTSPISGAAPQEPAAGAGQKTGSPKGRNQAQTPVDNEDEDSARLANQDISDAGKDENPGRPATAKVGSTTTTPSEGAGTGASTTPKTATGLTTNVRGARPNGGFFSAGAPVLTKEQIQAGKPIEGRCEGGNHKLVITSEHLAQLAQGRTVRVQSATNSHAFNPTIHSHAVTYTPFT
jgi:hypothetical protein